MDVIEKLEVIEVSLSDIQELQEVDYWYNEQTPPTPFSVAEHAKLIQEADLKHPIILCPKGRVMDGMHRCCKALIEGRTTIKAVQLPEMPAPDYVDVDHKDLPYDDDGQVL